MASITAVQVANLIAIERSTASISASATIILLLTYLCFKEFRTLPNTLLFAASPANLLASTASLIGGSGLNNVDGSTCQAQAFLLEWFMQSDPFWSCAAAITVFLVFFFRWGGERIKNIYWVYAILCYGIPVVPAIVCLIYNKNGPVYGNATLWCWIDDQYRWARIYTYYAPIWATIVISLAIYFIVGIHVYKARSQLMNGPRYNIYYSSGTKPSNATNTSGPPPLFIEQTTDIYQEVSRVHSLKYPDPIYSPDRSDPPTTVQSNEQNATVTPKRSRLVRLVSSTLSFFSAIFGKVPGMGLLQAWRRWKRMDEVKYKYTKCAALFAISILITWVPSSFNRVYGIIHPNGRLVYSLNVASAIVLPLQGFWNTVIFFSNSVTIVKLVWADIRAGRKFNLVGRILGWEADPNAISPLTSRRPSFFGIPRARVRSSSSTYGAP